MAILGLRDTNGFTEGERPKNYRQVIMRLYPNGQMVLTGLTSLMKSRTVDDPEFNWWEKEVSHRRFALGANLTTSNSEITLATTLAGAKELKAGDILWVEQTQEQMRVLNDPGSDTTIQVERGFAGTTKTAVDYDGTGINPNITCIGSAYEEGSNAPTGVGFKPTKVYNYTQIFRNTLEATRTATKTRLRTGDHVKEAKRECLELHGMDMERAFWLGTKSETTLKGKPIRTCDGVINFIASDNIKTVTTDYPGGLTMEGLEEYMYEMFKYGSSEKMAISGNRALLTLQQVIRKNTTWNIESGIKEFGMNVTRIMSPFGELVVKTHPLFNTMVGGTTGTGAYYGLESWIWCLDMNEFMYVSLTDSDTKYEKDLQSNGLDGMKAGYLGEVSLEVHHPKSHYLLKNVVAAAVDS